MALPDTVFYVIDLRSSVKDFEPYGKFLERFKAGCCDYAKRCTLLYRKDRLQYSVITIGKEVKFLIEPTEYSSQDFVSTLEKVGAVIHKNDPKSDKMVNTLKQIEEIISERFSTSEKHKYCIKVISLNPLQNVDSCSKIFQTYQTSNVDLEYLVVSLSKATGLPDENTFLLNEMAKKFCSWPHCSLKKINFDERCVEELFTSWLQEVYECTLCINGIEKVISCFIAPILLHYPSSKTVFGCKCHNVPCDKGRVYSAPRCSFSGAKLTEKNEICLLKVGRSGCDYSPFGGVLIEKERIANTFQVVQLASLDTIDDSLLFGKGFYLSPRDDEIEFDDNGKIIEGKKGMMLFEALRRIAIEKNTAIICTGKKTEPLELVHYYALFPDANIKANGFLVKELAVKEQVLTRCPYMVNKQRAEPSDAELKAVETALSVLPHKAYSPAESSSGFLTVSVQPRSVLAVHHKTPQLSTPSVAPERRKRRLKPLVAALESPVFPSTPSPHGGGKRAAATTTTESSTPSKRRHRLFNPEDQ